MDKVREGEVRYEQVRCENYEGVTMVREKEYRGKKKEWGR